MEYTDAKKLNGELILASTAADILKVTQAAINDFWKRGKLKKITATRNGKTKNYCSEIEVNQFKLIRDSQKKEEIKNKKTKK